MSCNRSSKCVQYNEHSPQTPNTCMYSAMNTPSKDHPKWILPLKIIQNEYSLWWSYTCELYNEYSLLCKTTQRQKQTPNVYNYITNILLSQTHK